MIEAAGSERISMIGLAILPLCHNVIEEQMPLESAMYAAMVL